MEENKDVCQICGGIGFVEYEKDGYRFMRPCECKELKDAKERLERSGISEEFQKKGFKNFNDRGMELLKKAKAMAIDYCKKFPEIRGTRYNSVLLQGQVGSGKTHLSMAICNAIMTNHKTGVLYMPYREEITKIKQCVRDAINYDNAISRYKNVPVLMIDDLLKGKSSDADVNILFEIINHRYIKNLPMIISTEKTTDELLDFDEGTMSRVIEMARGHQIEIVGREYNYRLYGEKG